MLPDCARFDAEVAKDTDREKLRRAFINRLSKLEPVLATLVAATLFTYDISATLRTHQYFVPSASVNVEFVSWTECFLFGRLVIRIGNGEFPFQNEMCRQTGMLVWWVVSIASRIVNT